MNKETIKFKQLLNLYRSDFYELEYINRVISETNPKFEEYKNRFINRKRVRIQGLNEKHKDRVRQIFTPSPAVVAAAKQRKETPYDSKKLFRQIARKFHPDKLSSDDPNLEEYEGVFKAARNAIDNNSWAELFDIAEKYDLELENYETINALLGKEIALIKKEINNKKATYGWLFHLCEKDEDKDKLMKRFLNHIYIDYTDPT
jgi:hypothetical protein